MTYVYACFGGTHSSAVAAAIHLGRLPQDRVPSPAEIDRVPFFDRVPPSARGRLQRVGRDPLGAEVYILACGREVEAMERLLQGALALAGREDLPLRFVSTFPCVNGWMRAGGFLSRRLGWVRLGRPLVIHGTRRAYPCLVRVVTEARR